ncbi:hypothetical protein LAZ40_16200 [Cereibacter sphaeroides]|uniref:hypothetical protein n=1 Tax=Cereibacter sphaeroides TaxID=1063 RepID=UPI001F492086|nr:hypothetical protein [Cereibacter sphaeroides]MCE6960567.1 hypothetical protein [Cereibacter sphaeroides]MCE6972752.1 hypothetical protein [Cereibacter sphaeroides]
MTAKVSPISFRLLPDTKAALDKAAADDRRSVSSLLDKIVTEWLEAKGYLEKL